MNGVSMETGKPPVQKPEPIVLVVQDSVIGSSSTTQSKEQQNG